MTKKILNKTKILEYQKNRDPYLMIDFADEVIPGKSSRGYKDLNINDWIFKVHWENDPNLPGMLQIEALVQMSSLAVLTLPGNKGKVMYLSSSNNVKFIKKVVPNCRFYIETKINNFKRGIANCEGIGKVNSTVVCKADFTLILPDELKKYRLHI